MVLMLGALHPPPECVPAALLAYIYDRNLTLTRKRCIMSPLRAPSTDRFALSVVHNLKHNAPKRATGPVELPATVDAAAVAAATFAAHKPHRLAVPVLHEVEIDTPRKIKGYLREGEESITEVGG
jgi:hypothetical protein